MTVKHRISTNTPKKDKALPKKKHKSKLLVNKKKHTAEGWRRVASEK